MPARRFRRPRGELIPFSSQQPDALVQPFPLRGAALELPGAELVSEISEKFVQLCKLVGVIRANLPDLHHPLGVGEHRQDPSFDEVADLVGSYGSVTTLAGRTHCLATKPAMLALPST
jgi:hypothetical protein